VSSSGIWADARLVPRRDDGFYEQMHFVAGAGTITDANGVVTEIRPGLVMLCPACWSSLWEVSETVRKTYAVVKTR
jgi:uncharacterized protein